MTTKNCEQAWPWLLALCCLLLPGGCRPTTGNSAPPPAPPEWMKTFRKLAQFQEWGFTDEAIRGYQKFQGEGYPREVRYQAFISCIAILEQQGKHQQVWRLREKMLPLFPQHGAALRRQIYEYCLRNWEFPRALQFGQAIIRQDQPDDMAELRKTVDFLHAWQQHKTVWQEKFAEFPPWKLGHPTFYRVDDDRRELEVTTLSGSWYHTGRYSSWDGSSWRLRLEMVVRKTEWAGTVSFGLFTGGPRQLVASFHCRGGTGDLEYALSLQHERNSRQVFASGPLTFTLDTWYTIEIGYCKQLKQACMKVWKRDTNEWLGQHIVDLPQPFAAGDYFIGVAPPPKFPAHPSVITIAAIDNVELLGNGWGEPKQMEELRTTYRFIEQLARDAWPLAWEYVTDNDNRQDKDYWRGCEACCYVNVPAAKRAEFVAMCLRNVLELQPEHANKDYFFKRFNK